MDGQMSLFDFINKPEAKPEPQRARKPSEDYPLREPCGRHCDVECFSKKCYIRRGYIWHPEGRHNWLRDDNGRIMIGPKDCDWEPKGQTCGTCQFFRNYTSGLGEIYHGTSCVKNAPFAVDVDADRNSCEYWREKEQDKIQNKLIKEWNRQ